LTPKGLATNVGQGCKYFVTVQHFPLLLAASHLDKHSYEMIANVVEDRTILSLLARERSQEFEKIIPEWGKKISELPHNCTIQDIMEASKNALANSKEIIDAAKLKVRELRASNTTQRNRIRYILARISRKIQFNAAVPGVPDLNVFLHTSLATRGKSNLGYDIEHIRPRAIYGSIDLTESIGNLVLAHPNDQRGAGDMEPFNKRNVYQTSNLYLTQSLCSESDLNLSNSQKNAIREIYQFAPPSLESWNDDSIQRRFELYWQIFLSDLAIPAK
jgi:hypothetical protein